MNYRIVDKPDAALRPVFVIYGLCQRRVKVAHEERGFCQSVEKNPPLLSIRRLLIRLTNGQARDQ